mgnify:CR=1 FL=1
MSPLDEQASVTMLYFASLREKIGKDEELMTLPATVKTVADLLDHLSGLDDAYDMAFADRQSLRVAINQDHADFDAKLTGAREIAFFPPMTGG